MCLAVPCKVLSVDTEQHTADVGVRGSASVRRTVSTLLLEEVSPDDWVQVHVGFAEKVIDEDLALQTIADLERMEA